MFIMSVTKKEMQGGDEGVWDKEKTQNSLER